MSKWNTADKTDIYEALVVDVADGNDYDVVEFLRLRSRADDGREVVW